MARSSSIFRHHCRRNQTTKDWFTDISHHARFGRKRRVHNGWLMKVYYSNISVYDCSKCYNNFFKSQPVKGIYASFILFFNKAANCELLRCSVTYDLFLIFGMHEYL